MSALPAASASRLEEAVAAMSIVTLAEARWRHVPADLRQLPPPVVTIRPVPTEQSEVATDVR